MSGVGIQFIALTGFRGESSRISGEGELVSCWFFLAVFCAAQLGWRSTSTFGLFYFWFGSSSFGGAALQRLYCPSVGCCLAVLVCSAAPRDSAVWWCGRAMHLLALFV